jgi:hypothetical protein
MEARKLSIYYGGNTDINKYSMGAIILEQANRTRECVSTQHEADNWSREDGYAEEKRFMVGREVGYKEANFGITIIAMKPAIISTTNSDIPSYQGGLEAGHREEKFAICRGGSTIMSLNTSTSGYRTKCEN